MQGKWHWNPLAVAMQPLQGLTCGLSFSTERSSRDTLTSLGSCFRALLSRRAVLESPPEQEFLVLGEPWMATILILSVLSLVASARYSAYFNILLFRLSTGVFTGAFSF